MRTRYGLIAALAMLAGALANQPAFGREAFDVVSGHGGQEWEKWQVVVLVIGQVLLMIMAVGALLRWTFAQYQMRIENQFSHMIEVRKQMDEGLLIRIDHLQNGHASQGKRIGILERDLMEFKAHVSGNFVDRESTMIWWGGMMAKMDKIARIVRQQQAEEK